MRLLKENAIAATLYLLMLLLSERFALFYEVQPVIWPVSAVFLAVALTYGQRALFGPLLISLIYISLDIRPGSETIGMGFSLSIAVVMTALNYFRVWVLLKLVRRFIGAANLNLNSPSDMVRFLIIAGPIGGLLGAVLVIPAVLAVPELTFNFRVFLLVRWWIAMTTGGLIFTPVLLILLRPPSAHPLARRVYLTTSTGAIGLLFGMLWFIRSEIQTEIETFNHNINSQSTMAITEHFDEVESVTNSLRAALLLKQDMTDVEFRQLAKRLATNEDYLIDFLSWSPILLNNNRPLFEQTFGCNITRLNSNKLMTQTPQNSYVPIQYLYPGNVADEVLCFDLLSEPRRAKGILKSIGQRKASLTEPVTLAKQTTKAVLLYEPVMDANNRAIGLISAVVSLEQIVQSTLEQLTVKDINFSIGHVKNNQVSVLYDRIIDNADALDPQIRRFDLSIYDQDWQVIWQPKVSALSQIYNWQINLFSTIGAFFVILIQYMGYRLVIINITVQSEVKNKTEQFEQAKQMAEKASETKGQFLANMSHEIRTPLNAILGFAELAKTEETAEKKQEYLDGIWSSSEALLSLVNDVLDYSKIEAGKLELHAERFTLDQIAQRLEAIFSLQIRNKGLEFKFSYDKELPYEIYADDARIQQILLNLCSNALKFTHQGYIRVALHLETTSPTKGIFRATVEDSGIGISSEEQSRVFEEFTQADASITRQFGGTGLGLAISYTLAKLLGGDLTLRSQLGVGTAFQLSAPVELKEKQTRIEQTQHTFLKHKILIVDDNAVNLKVTEALLRKSGFDVLTANNGLTAIDIVYRSKPDLILMDMQMPEIDGLETTRRIREFYSNEELTVVGLTANATQEDRHRCIAAGMNDHLSKPISLDKLSLCLTHWLQ